MFTTQVKMQESEMIQLKSEETTLCYNFMNLDRSMKYFIDEMFSLAVLMITDDLPKTKLEIFRLAARTF